MATDIPIKYNTAIVDVYKKSDDTSLDTNLCDYNLLLQIQYKFINNDNIKFKGTCDFINLYNDIDTSLNQISVAKKYNSKQNRIQNDIIEINGFVKKLQILSVKNTDKALIHIFNVIDDWNIINEVSKFDKLFDNLINIILNEDIYVSILASTILVKENEKRIKYFKFVYNQLSQKYNEKDLQIILKGL